MASLIPEFPIVDGPRSRFVHSFTDTYGQHIFHSHNSQQAPSFDISETDDAYFLDGDFPGLANKSDINLKWTGKRTLIVEANVLRPDYEALWQLHFSHPLRRISKTEDANADGKMQNGNGNASHGVGPAFSDLIPSLKRSRSSTAGTDIRQWVRERHTGQLYRAFTFPEDVETGSVKAKFHQGQLNLMVSKSDPGHAENREILIGDC